MKPKKQTATKSTYLQTLAKQTNINMALNQLLQELSATQLKTSQLTSSLRMIQNKLNTAVSDSQKISTLIGEVDREMINFQSKELAIKRELMSTQSTILKAKSLLEEERSFLLLFARDIVHLKNELGQTKSSSDTSRLKHMTSNFQGYCNIFEAIVEDEDGEDAEPSLRERQDKDCSDEKSDSGATTSSPLRARTSADLAPRSSNTRSSD